MTMASTDHDREPEGDYEPILRESKYVRMGLKETKGNHPNLKKLLTNRGGTFLGNHGTGMFLATSSVQDYQRVLESSRPHTVRVSRSSGRSMTAQTSKLNRDYLPGIPTFNHLSVGIKYQIHPMMMGKYKTLPGQSVVLRERQTRSLGQAPARRPATTAFGLKEMRRTEQSLLSKRVTMTSEKSASQQGIIKPRSRNQRCYCGSSECRCWCESKDEAGLVFTVPCSEHKHTNCSLKLYMCSAAKIYFPFSRFKWKKKPQNQDGSKLVTMAGAKLRALLKPAKIGETVLFRNPDDGWYYTGTVSLHCGNHLYIITDCNGHQEEIWRENFICKFDRDIKNPENGEKVLAIHPGYPRSYLPGTVINDKDRVELSDGMKTQTDVQNSDFVIPKAQYQNDVKYINNMADKWLKENVIARKKDAGEYHLGTVIGRYENSCVKFKIQWIGSESDSDNGKDEKDSEDSRRGQTEVVDVTHMFGWVSQSRKLAIGVHVLAPVRENDVRYQAGIVQEMSENKPPPKESEDAVLQKAKQEHKRVYQNPLPSVPAVPDVKRNQKKVWARIKFVSKHEEWVHVDYCFWISRYYYTNALAAYIDSCAGRQKSKSSKDDSSV